MNYKKTILGSLISGRIIMKHNTITTGVFVSISLNMNFKLL